jgi:hypothetical protein
MDTSIKPAIALFDSLMETGLCKDMGGLHPSNLQL